MDQTLVSIAAHLQDDYAAEVVERRIASIPGLSEHDRRLLRRLRLGRRAVHLPEDALL